ncbi:ABC transporter substrate-binding protein [Minwuia thermotolerans]|uniref:ABC transporter substrate-binding protein n=1 Tax=Minwuia thermotolerans TaxID=2056226 RepID=A0A2M9G3L0_9PROT|nr:ABC transporter substrate-binding protein [Minwuia thermotolerans]PJK30288.1 ABC transporter substrate-binding protein [Minwuia thermotolerans]
MTRTLRAALAALAIMTIAPAVLARCEVDKPVTLADLNWDSSAFHVAVAARILKDGYGCHVERKPGATRPLFKALARGEVDIMMEVWKDNIPTLWRQAAQAGDVIEMGVNYPDAVQGWFVPAYLVQGEDAPAPDLESVRDLAGYRDLFADPEDRGKGRFYNCMLGWGCEKVNTRKLHAYGLADDFNNFRPVSGRALVRAIASHYEKREPFLTYYWGPTWVLGTYDLVMLEEPPYDPDIWSEMNRTRRPEAATAYPTSAITIAVSDEFAEAAPEIVGFLESYRTSNDLVSAALADMRRLEGDAEAAARRFLTARPEIWTEWVPEDVARRVREGLS